jgi:predicted dehydrogenase
LKPVGRLLRLGIAGFGRLAREHYLPALRAVERARRARLCAIADPLAGSREAAARLVPEAAVSEDHRRMLDEASLDAVLVATPPSTHLSIWKDAACHGVAVFMEKPLILYGQLGEIGDAGAGGRLMLDFNRRFWPPYREVARLVRAGELGRPVEIDFALHTDVISWSTVTRHRLSPEEGGILHDLGGHAIDLASDLLGEEPGSVTANLASLAFPDDRLSLEFAFRDGSVVRCDLGYDASTRERIAIRGPKGTLLLRDPNMAIHVSGNGAATSGLVSRLRDVAAVAGRVLRPGRTMTRYSIACALASFVRALDTGEPFTPGLEEAVRNVRWLEAAAISAADGKPAQPA